MGKPVVIESDNHWDATLAAAKEKKQPVFVDFFATWCGPCKVIAPMYEHLAMQYSNAVFLKVDVDLHQAIAQKYKVTAMPTFLVIVENDVVDKVCGADPAALRTMVSSAAASDAKQPTGAAEKAKLEGNAAFAAGKYAEAVEHYSRAIELAPQSAVLFGNRAFAYMKIIRLSGTRKEERQALREKAVKDADSATMFDEKWAKGWIRLAEAWMLAGDEEGMEKLGEGKRKEGRMLSLTAAKAALVKAIGLSDGKLRAEAQKMLEDIQQIEM